MIDSHQNPTDLHHPTPAIIIKGALSHGLVINAYVIVRYIDFCRLLINKQQNITMIRNSTKKFKERYAYSSVKKIGKNSGEREESQSLVRSLRFNTTTYLNLAKSTPKLENHKQLFLKTQPVISNHKKAATEDKYSLFTDHTSIETIQTAMKKKGIQESQLLQHKSGKLKRVSRNSVKIRDPEDFIQNLPKNSLFFCCQCYQYIFDIEKLRHFPDCKDQLHRSSGNIAKIGVQKLQKVVELANYTDTYAQKINKLYGQFVDGTHNNFIGLDYPKYNFFTLQQITYSFAYIFDQLLRNVKYESDSTIFSCF